MTQADLPGSRRRSREQRTRRRSMLAGWALVVLGVPMIVVGGLFLFRTGPTGEPIPQVGGTNVIRTTTTTSTTTGPVITTTTSTTTSTTTVASPSETTTTVTSPNEPTTTAAR